MTESIPSDNFSTNKDLDPSVARVFFDESADWMDFSVVEPQPVSMRVGARKVLFETLATAKGSILAPAVYFDESGDKKTFVEFGHELVPVNNIVNGHYFESPLLRTREKKRNMSLIDSVLMLGSNVDALEMQVRLSHDEWAEAEDYYHALRQLLASRKDLWLRLEASPGADDHLVGKTMIAKLVMFMTEFRYDGVPIDEQGEPGVFPLVYDHNERRLGFIPEQLTLLDPWLYLEIDEDEV